jgi:hypothetical protein
MRIPEVKKMDNKRLQSGDRRDNKDRPGFPFRDCNGRLIKVCRRKVPDRRLDNIQAEWIDEVVIRETSRRQ